MADHDALSKGKRKRISDEPLQTAADKPNEKEADGGRCDETKPLMGDKGGSGKRTSVKKKPSNDADCLVEWPRSFKSLEKTHRALNLVLTFCCTRKHLATTFDTIKPAVEAHLGRPLAIDEVALVVALRPEGINFAYVDELMLQLDIKGSEKDDAFKPPKSGRSQAPAHDASVGSWTGSESLDAHHRHGDASSGKQVLFLEFIDGDLKRQVQDKKTGEPKWPRRKLREEELKLPVYGQKQMMQLIERRNQRFAHAVNSFINECMERNLDPDLALEQRAQAYIPQPWAACEDAGGQAPKSMPESIPKDRKSIPEIVQELKESDWYTGQIVPDGHRVFEPQEPVFGELNFLLSQNLVNALYNAKGITKLYAHQAEALNSLDEGQNVVVATSTSSGKSLIYQLPVLHALERDGGSRAMYIFPTKALAQDQKRSLKDLLSYMAGLEESVVETMDGDTPMSERNAIRDEARVILTNPDMLHATILPQEERWRTFLANLKFVVGTLPQKPRRLDPRLTPMAC